MRRFDPLPLQVARHQPEADKARAVERNRDRALPTNSARWRKIRAAQLSKQPLCEHCQARGRVKAAAEVDHIDNDSANNAPENLASLCKSCHTRKGIKAGELFPSAKRREGSGGG